jgi:peptidoglycan-N-acetylglucosamine deacetylase
MKLYKWGSRCPVESAASAGTAIDAPCARRTYTIAINRCAGEMRFFFFVISITLVANACGAQQRARPSRGEFWGFAAPWDAQSDATIREHGHHLGAVVTGWVALDSLSGQPLLPSPFTDTVRPRLATNATARRMAIVTSWHGERFHTASILRLARDPAALSRAAGEIARHAQSMRYSGLVFDFETLTAADLDAQLTVMSAIADSARARGVRMIAVAVPATDTIAYPANRLLRVADAIIPMLYDEHWAGSAPGPVASPQWVRSALTLRVREAGAARVIAGFPTYGYRWIRGQATEALGYDDARRIAAAAGVSLARDAATQSLRARDANWDMWMADSETLRTLVGIARELSVNRFALWRLGREDPAIWGSVVH